MMRVVLFCVFALVCQGATVQNKGIGETEGSLIGSAVGAGVTAAVFNPDGDSRGMKGAAAAGGALLGGGLGRFIAGQSNNDKDTDNDKPEHKPEHKHDQGNVELTETGYTVHESRKNDVQNYGPCLDPEIFKHDISHENCVVRPAWGLIRSYGHALETEMKYLARAFPPKHARLALLEGIDTGDVLEDHARRRARAQVAYNCQSKGSKCVENSRPFSMIPHSIGLSPSCVEDILFHGDKDELHGVLHYRAKVLANVLDKQYDHKREEMLWGGSPVVSAAVSICMRLAVEAGAGAGITAKEHPCRCEGANWDCDDEFSALRLDCLAKSYKPDEVASKVNDNVFAKAKPGPYTIVDSPFPLPCVADDPENDSALEEEQAQYKLPEEPYISFALNKWETGTDLLISHNPGTGLTLHGHVLEVNAVTRDEKVLTITFSGGVNDYTRIVGSEPVHYGPSTDSVISIEMLFEDYAIIAMDWFHNGKAFESLKHAAVVGFEIETNILGCLSWYGTCTKDLAPGMEFGTNEVLIGHHATLPMLAQHISSGTRLTLDLDQSSQKYHVEFVTVPFGAGHESVISEAAEVMVGWSETMAQEMVDETPIRPKPVFPYKDNAAAEKAGKDFMQEWKKFGKALKVSRYYFVPFSQYFDDQELSTTDYTLAPGECAYSMKLNPEYWEEETFQAEGNQGVYVFVGGAPQASFDVRFDRIIPFFEAVYEHSNVFLNHQKDFNFKSMIAKLRKTSGWSSLTDTQQGMIALVSYLLLRGKTHAGPAEMIPYLKFAYDVMPRQRINHLYKQGIGSLPHGDEEDLKTSDNSFMKIIKAATGVDPESTDAVVKVLDVILSKHEGVDQGNPSVDDFMKGLKADVSKLKIPSDFYRTKVDDSDNEPVAILEIRGMVPITPERYEDMMQEVLKFAVKVHDPRVIDGSTIEIGTW